jgi:hypothetical protein
MQGEPTFTPAQGWTEFNPRGGMVLLAIFQPPRRLTHRQIMALSLRDVSKIMAVRHPQSKQQIEHTPESLIHHQMSGNLSKSHVFDTPAHEPETAF